MSIVAPSQRRLVWPVAIALTLAMLIALLLYLPNRAEIVTPATIAAPGVTQADWDVNAFPAGGDGVGELSKKATERYKAQRAPLASLIHDVYDALFLSPAGTKRVIQHRFAADAARQALASKIGLPSGVEEVQITKRLARVGIHVQGATRAAARVAIAGTATKNGRKARFEHNSVLWLERDKGEWKVIAFDVTQGSGK